MMYHKTLVAEYHNIYLRSNLYFIAPYFLMIVKQAIAKPIDNNYKKKQLKVFMECLMKRRINEI